MSTVNLKTSIVTTRSLGTKQICYYDWGQIIMDIHVTSLICSSDKECQKQISSQFIFLEIDFKVIMLCPASDATISFIKLEMGPTQISEFAHP